MENKTKKLASHTVALVLGLMFASCVRSPRTEIVTVEKEVIKEVPVDRVIEKEIIKYITKIKKVFVHVVHVENLEPQYVEQYSVSVVRYSQRLSLLGGVGPKSLLVTPLSNGYLAEISNGFVWGVGYQLRVYKRHNVGLQFLSNKTSMLSYGFDF